MSLGHYATRVQGLPAHSKKFVGVGCTRTVAICAQLPSATMASPKRVNVFGWLSKYGEKRRMKNSLATSPAPSLMIHCTATAPKKLPSALTPTDVSSAWLHSTETTVPNVVSKNCRTWKGRYLRAARGVRSSSEGLYGRRQTGCREAGRGGRLTTGARTAGSSSARTSAGATT